MQIAANSTLIGTGYEANGSIDADRSADERLQDVFTAVLNQVGREGYASAQPLATEDSLATQLTSGWEQWFNEVGQYRYRYQADAESPSVRENKSAQDLKEDYKQLLQSAYDQGGYATPQAFIKSLSEDQLETIQQVQHLAEAIDPNFLSDEASLNLMIPPSAHVDANHDGLTAVGAGYMIQFPNSNTPSDVVDAWEAATAELSESDRMHYSLQMMLPVLYANMHVDSNGNFIRQNEPGDAEWTNPMNSPDYSYEDAAKNWIDYLDRFKNQMPIEQYERDKAFWSIFRLGLEK